MKNEPKVIYLNCFDEAETDPTYLPIDDDFDSLEGENVLWSSDSPCLGGHIKYIHHSEVDEKVKEAVKIALQTAADCSREMVYDKADCNAHPEGGLILRNFQVCYATPKHSTLSLEQEVLEKLKTL